MTLFAHGWWLFAGAALAGLAAWSVVHEWRRRAAARAAIGAMGTLARVGVGADDGARRRAGWLRVGAIACVALALARPQWGSVDGSLGRSGRDVLVALDLSRSMLVDDARGTRLERAKRLAVELADASPGDRVGLIVFGGAAFLQLPLTADHAAFARFVAAASPEVLDDPSTNIAAAVHVAVTTFKHGAEDGPRAIVLVSDGERSEGSLDPVVEEVVKAKVPVFAIGVGTLAGGLVPADTAEKGDSGSQWHRDNIGRPVQSRLDEESLKRLADGSFGAYAKWDDAPRMAALRRQLQSLPTRTGRAQQVLERAERFQWPLALAALLLAWEFLLGVLPPARGGRLAGAAIALVAMGVSSCATRGTALRAASRAYADGKYAEALAGFQQAYAQEAEPAVRYDIGNTQVRLNKYLDAIKSYREVPSEDPALRIRALFNLGVAYVRGADQVPDAEKTDLYNRAITAFEDVLSSTPNDADAKWNLELAIRKRGDVETSGSAGRGGRAQAGRSQGSESGLNPDREQAVGAMAGGGQGDAQGESAEELDEDRARQLLETIERQQLENHEGRPAKSGNKGSRDW